MDHDLSLLNRYHEQGDARAFQTLVATHGGMVFAVARRVTQDAALAEEVAQDVFLALARKGKGIRQSVAAWLHHVAWQKAANGVRGKVRRAQYEREAAALMQGRESDWSEIEPMVDEALAELSEEMRAVLIEHFLEQRTQAEMAKSRGVSQATVSRRIDAGLQQLRDRLRARGIVAGGGLAAMLEVHAVVSVPASLAAGLGKLALTRVGGGLGMVVASEAGLSLKAMAAALVVAGCVSVAAFDLASRDSVLMRWFGSREQIGELVETETGERRAAESQRVKKGDEERWAAEAREIWSKAP
jgi:RNA polymerase sigma factor (sigma-70 family)